MAARTTSKMATMVIQTVAPRLNRGDDAVVMSTSILTPMPKSNHAGDNHPLTQTRGSSRATFFDSPAWSAASTTADTSL